MNEKEQERYRCPHWSEYAGQICECTGCGIIGCDGCETCDGQIFLKEGCGRVLGEEDADF